jgi:hypothetical protein
LSTAALGVGGVAAFFSSSLLLFLLLMVMDLGFLMFGSGNVTPFGVVVGHCSFVKKNFFVDIFSLISVAVEHGGLF